MRGQRLSSWRSRAASVAPWFPDGTIQGDVGEGGASAADWAPGTEKAPFWEPSVPSDVLFSNSMLEDMEKIWALRDIIPDPTKIPLKSDI